MLDVFCKRGVGGGRIEQEQGSDQQLETLSNEKKRHGDEKRAEEKKCVKQIHLTHKLTEDESAFYIADMRTVTQRLVEFSRFLPRVRMYYAVKCNPDMNVLRTVAKFGAGFDVASATEMNKVSKIIPRNELAARTIFANPVKQSRHMCLANRLGIDLFTFDNDFELIKIHRHSPNARLLLRIAVDDSTSRIPLASKFGASTPQVGDLFNTALRLNLNVVGVAFHVGSGAKCAKPYLSALQLARSVFNMAVEMGMKPLSILDIGGGFPAFDGEVDVTFEQIAKVIRPKIDLWFDEHVQVVAEPGRFVVGAAFSLVTKIMSRRMRGDVVDYFIADGVYGSFKDAVLLRMKYEIRLLDESNAEQTKTCNVYGATGEMNDVIVRDVKHLPLCNVGDWIVFHNMGAYTIAFASHFGNLPCPTIHYLN